MNLIRAVLNDRRRSQSGSVLSGVLIMMAFIAILSGALMTELSTNFLLSSNLMTRSLNEATVNSSMELAVNQLQTMAINQGCPDLTPAAVNVNGRLAVPSYQSCWPAYREKVYTPIATSSAFNVDASHSMLPTASPAQDLYVVGDSGGNVYQFAFGSSSPTWTYSVPGRVTGPPGTVRDLDPSQNANDLMTLVPMSAGSGAPSACTSSGYCVAMLAGDTGTSPDHFCYMAASDQVTSSAAMGANYPTVGFFGDQKGSLFAYSVGERNIPCPQKANVSGSGQGVVAGPFVFAGPAGVDEVYAVTSNAVLRYTYTEPSGQPPQLALKKMQSLPWSGAVGAALDQNALPARLVISFSTGQLALVQLQSNFGITLGPTAGVPTSIPGAPTWCHCAGGTDQIAVGGTNGVLYLYDTLLNQIASLATAGAPVSQALATDALGEWFYGDGSGYVHEIQRLAGQSTMTEVATYGPVSGAIGSSLTVGRCSGEICIYAATQNGRMYRVPLDARDVVITACISATVPTCSGANPRLWTKMEVGREGSPNEVHVQGWSYYSA